MDIKIWKNLKKNKNRITSEADLRDAQELSIL